MYLSSSLSDSASSTNESKSVACCNVMTISIGQKYLFHFYEFNIYKFLNFLIIKYFLSMFEEDWDFRWQWFRVLGSRSPEGYSQSIMDSGNERAMEMYSKDVSKSKLYLFCFSELYRFILSIFIQTFWQSFVLVTVGKSMTNF